MFVSVDINDTIMNSSSIAKINEVEIVILNDENEKRVAVKPICEALGIAEEPQVRKIKEDEILSSVATLTVATGSDGKSYEMLTIPLEYAFGWLFTINAKNVKEEARENLIKYKKECYHALYKHFTLQSEFLEEKQTKINVITERVKSNRNHQKTNTYHTLS